MVFIIAEAGSNWWGDPDESMYDRLDRAKRLVRKAADCGADAVKFQAFRASDLYKEGTDHWKTVKPLELPLEWLPILAGLSNERGTELMCSAFSEEMVNAIDPYVKRHKVASLEITDLSLLRHIASKGKPVIMSTGAADIGQVWTALHEMHSVLVSVLLCTTAYPCPPNEVGLSSMSDRFSHFDGLSDHTLDPVVAPVMAVALGATVIEKHFTLSRSLVGPDHHYSLEPQELKQMVDAVRLAEKMLGDGAKRIQPSEMQWRQWQHRDGGVRGG